LELVGNVLDAEVVVEGGKVIPEREEGNIKGVITG